MQQRTFSCAAAKSFRKTSFNHKVGQETKQTILALIISSQVKKTKRKINRMVQIGNKGVLNAS